MEFRQVVVGFDRSEQAITAAEWAIAHSRADGQVHLVEIASRVDDSTAEALARSVAGIAVDPGQPAPTFEVVEGSDPADALLERSQLVGAEAIVVGAKEHQRWHPHRVSPTAARLHHRGVLPLATVRRSSAQLGSVCVGVDGTDESWAALRWVIDRTGSDDQVRVVWIVGEGVRGEIPTLPVASMDVLKRAVTAYLDQQVGEIAGDRSAKVTTDVRVGYAAADLLDSASDCEILVVGHGHHGRLGELLGSSVSLQLLREFDRTMIVVP